MKGTDHGGIRFRVHEDQDPLILRRKGSPRMKTSQPPGLLDISIRKKAGLGDG
jgi:hypothetical protein